MRKFLRLVQDKAQELRRLQQEPAPGGGRCGYEQRKKKRTERANKSKKKQVVEVQLQGGEELGGREGLPGGEEQGASQILYYLYLVDPLILGIVCSMPCCNAR